MLRRNGKPRSCEPCRISKIRCDHATPKCSKCESRGIAERCFYHPNPMTKPPGTPRKQPTEPRKRVVKPRNPEPRPASRDHETASTLLLSPTTLRGGGFQNVNVGGTNAPSEWPTPPDSARALPNPPDTTRSYYLGSTSYASIFAEQHSLPESVHESPTVVTPSAVAQKHATGSPFCQTGVGHSILAKLRPFSFYDTAIKMYFEDNKAPALVGPLIKMALPQLREDLEQLTALGSDSVPAFAAITRNTAMPLKVPSSMPASNFHTLFTGQNLRWETLGLILIVAGSIAQYTSPDHPIFTLEDGSHLNKDKFIEDMIHTSNDCINLCQVHGASMLVMSNFYGDNYHGVWRRMGDTISALYAEGIHCEESFPDEPFFLREARRRIHASVFRSDKTLATFFGRPPMMSSRYSDRPLPFDVDDNILATSDTELLSETLSRLDSDGWNTDGEIWASSFIRLRYQMSLFKERVLEQSLAAQTDDNLVEKVQGILAECHAYWESVPAHLRYELHDEDAVWTDMDPGIALRMIITYLEYLHLDFSMQRLLRRQTQLAVPALLEISNKVLSTVLVFNKQRNQVYNIQRHFPTIILFHCLPSAGVLALELRRCTLENVPLPGAVSRADSIRNLSVLISCMDWVILPGDGNHKLCSELNKMLALVLDEVLNYQPPPASENQEDGTGALGALGPSFFDMPMVDGMEPIPTESEDFLNWLDNANWSNTVSASRWFAMSPC
ncbi:hypothetical protein EJ04DRAFT_531021 [Polyplosphaeria fusca]|uniref:Zn(2)-C6 fungal-type domain-containing protein n=1 Tax=Polyplosphaeria fusca TaxID=682080 RepID=A0A9P4RBD2_9PLEO|nr:hypothetical protein EJ04DRAFT_531021 [Polyplosphaeria fusca]